MQYWVSYTRNGQTSWGSYTGQTQATILALLNQLGASSVLFLTEQDYNAVLQKLMQKFGGR